MLLSKALSLTASSLLGFDRAPARTSFDVYLMILSTCVAVYPKIWPSLMLSAITFADSEACPLYRDIACFLFQ